MKELTLSICIPTFNRARYLAVLLNILAETQDALQYSYELIITDNASTDQTEDVVRGFMQRLPIRYFKQPTNIGPESNWLFAMAQANGKYFLYLADDDSLDMHELTRSVQLLIEHPEAAVLYAPWKLFDLVNNADCGTFYSQSSDILVRKGDFASLIKNVVSNRVWPEVAIGRTELFRRLMPKFNCLSYWAFTVPCEYLTYGHIIFSKTPFYVSITNYFADEVREQCGLLETESAWDRYRGGWEYMLGRAISNLTQEEIPILRAGLDRMVIDRMAVALRLRLQGGSDPIDNYYLACRLRGLGAESMLPASLDDIRSKAAQWFVTHDSTLLSEAESICCVGGFDPSVVAVLRGQTQLPVASSVDMPEGLENAVVLLKGEFSDHRVNVDQERRRGNKMTAEADLMRKFA